MKNMLFVLAFFCTTVGFSQSYKPFEGKLVYRIEFQPSLDSVAQVQSRTTIYTNDTLVRIESETIQFGSQVLIKHLLLRKYYLLLEFEGKKFAIQQHMPADTVASKYTFKKKFGKKKIAGMKAKRVLVSAKSFEKPIEMWYFPSISPKYLDVLKDIKGLPVDYYIQMEDGFLHYILETIEPVPVSKDMFGIPSDYRKVSFDEFMDMMMPTE